ncbi:MAG TPA: hypothetical protein VFF35_12025 [Bacteroidia bacterium]|nr:hypothetical protein [Bacteroidia bacterium]
MKKITSITLAAAIVILAFSCKKDNISKDKISGISQKGPFING